VVDDCKANIRSSKVHGDIPWAAKERQEGLEQGTKAYKSMGNSPQAYKDDKRVYKRDEDDIDPSQGGIRSQTKSISVGHEGLGDCKDEDEMDALTLEGFGSSSLKPRGQ